MPTERRIVDNRVFLLGLDKLYRDAMKHHERGELLHCARRVAAAVRAAPADVAIEGYYGEDAELTEYFRLMRALQQVDESASSAVDALPEFERLRAVTSAPLYGIPLYTGMLLPAGNDPLSQALDITFPDWTVAGLTSAARDAARATDDFSLVGLAARIEDPVVLTALRESVVLYARVPIGAAGSRPRIEYAWAVDPELARQAQRFIAAFNALFGEDLPPAEPAMAERYWRACDKNRISGRCVRLGWDDATTPPLHYHWAIYRTSDGELTVQEFWNPDVWTTERYRSALPEPWPRHPDRS